MPDLKNMGVSRSEEEVALARRCGSGDEAALAELLALHGSAARGVAYRVLRDDDLAEDALQEALIGFWRSAGSFDPARTPLRAWLCVLTHRRAVDLVRREARHVLRDGNFSELDPLSYTVEELVVLRDEQRHVQDAVAALTRAQRQVVELAFFGDLTHEQVAECLGLPLGTVKSRMFVAMRRLADMLTRVARPQPSWNACRIVRACSGKTRDPPLRRPVARTRRRTSPS